MRLTRRGRAVIYVAAVSIPFFMFAWFPYYLTADWR